MAYRLDAPRSARRIDASVVSGKPRWQMSDAAVDALNKIWSELYPDAGKFAYPAQVLRHVRAALREERAKNDKLTQQVRNLQAKLGENTP